MRPIYHYTNGQLLDFWVTCNECDVDDGLLSDIKDAPEVILQKMRRHFLSQGMTAEQTCDVLWWLNLLSLTKHGIPLFESKDRYWIFNTPEHPFEAYLVRHIRSIENVDAYSMYETIYPSK